MPRTTPAGKRDAVLLPADDNRPVQTVRHRNIKAAIWRNRSDKGPMFSVTVSRSYRDGDAWKDSHSFSYDEIMNLTKVLLDAHTCITTLRDKERAKQQTVTPKAASGGSASAAKPAS
jgi:hypothetical protein